MGFSNARSRTAGHILLILALSGAAHAAEQMHMPFDCAFDGVRVRLRPSEDRSYAVLGRHEHQILTACSPTEPERCGSWLVHRFDFDCDGARVAWLDAAVAAAHFADWDAWIEDGRFSMRMNPSWGVARERPMFPRRRWMGRRHLPQEGSFAGDADGYGAPSVVTAPPGFAPAAGIPLTFSGAGMDGIAETEDELAPAPAADAAPAVQPAPEAMPALPERAPRKPAQQAIAPATRVAAAHETALTEAGKDASEGTKANDAKGPDGAAPPATSGAVTPTIINGPRSATAEPPVPTPSAPPAKDGSPATETGAAPAATTMARAAETNGSAGMSADVEPSASVETAALPSAEDPEPAAAPMRLGAVAAAALLLAILAAFAFWWSKRWRAPAPPANRDIANVSLDGGTQGKPLAIDRAPVAAGPQVPNAQSGGAEPALGDLPVPATYAEALNVLGASPDASIAAIKKIVDGLRQSWHPDLARSEADRIYRERRLRQINVAWDLVEQRRTAA
jgi:hypothetical protein